MGAIFVVRINYFSFITGNSAKVNCCQLKRRKAIQAERPPAKEQQGFPGLRGRR
jgi:hypothetical protein